MDPGHESSVGYGIVHRLGGRVRAAASSIPSGRPSRRAQTSATGGASRAVRVKEGLTIPSCYSATSSAAHAAQIACVSTLNGTMWRIPNRGSNAIGT